jgi:hypothetical protein
MRRLNPDELQQLKTDMLRILLEKKTFHKFRLFNKWFVIAIDGNRLMTFSKFKFASDCLGYILIRNTGLVKHGIAKEVCRKNF